MSYLPKPADRPWAFMSSPDMCSAQVCDLAFAAVLVGDEHRCRSSREPTHEVLLALLRGAAFLTLASKPDVNSVYREKRMSRRSNSLVS